MLEIFVGRDESKMTALNTTSAMLDKIISDKASDHDFIPKKTWVAKCIQMVHAANVSKSFFFLTESYFMKVRCLLNLDMVLCGSTNSGKSSAALLMIDVLTQMQQQQQLQTSSQQQKSSSSAQESNYALEMTSQMHKLYRYFISSEEIIYPINVYFLE